MKHFVHPARVAGHDSTRRSHDASDDMTGSATTAPYRTPTCLPAAESMEAVVRKRNIMFVGFMARTGDERLSQRVMFGQVVGGKSYSRGQEKD